MELNYSFNLPFETFKTCINQSHNGQTETLCYFAQNYGFPNDGLAGEVQVNIPFHSTLAFNMINFVLKQALELP